MIRNARVSQGLKQEDLAGRAGVSRAIVSRLESGKSNAVQTDTIDKLFDALAIQAPIGGSGGDSPRRLARLEQEIRRSEQRERHLRLALALADNPLGAAAKIARARKRVELWRRNKTCSAFYIERWSGLLAMPPRKLAKEMTSLGEWEDAMFQNSPWSWAWT